METKYKEDLLEVLNIDELNSAKCTGCNKSIAIKNIEKIWEWWFSDNLQSEIKKGTCVQIRTNPKSLQESIAFCVNFGNKNSGCVFNSIAA